MRNFSGSRSLALIALLSTTFAIPGQAREAASAAKAAETKADRPAQAIVVAPTPAWVRDRAIPEATKARIESAQGGIAYLLTDEQYRTLGNGHDIWFRAATKVTNRSGLESTGQLTASFDPSFESVDLNFVHLIRDGKVIDVTADAHFRVVEREDDLGDGIVTGMLKAIANLPDVRVGDIVDYAMTTHSRTTLWPGHGFYHVSQRYSDPLALRTLRFVWPSGMMPRSKALNSDIAFTTRNVAEGTEWEWIVQDPPALRAEADVPSSAFIWGRVDISTMKDWAELARWATALYQGDESLPADFAARLDAIAKASPAAADRLTEAARFVQDNIRYVGEELGEGSYVPRRPKTVLARGYGDCKDKALLLVVALRRLGIEAAPALVSTRAGTRLPDQLPSPLEFDHVIVRAVIDGKVIWIDATGSHRGGRGLAIVPSDLGYALPIRAGQTTLERMEGYRERAGRASVLEQFAVDEAAAVPLTLHVETRYTDARADAMRANIAAGSASTIAENNLKFYRDRFPGLVESAPLSLRDDRDGNVLTMIENYTMARDAFDKAKIPAKLITRAYMVQNVLPDRQANPRVAPLALTNDAASDQTIELRAKDRVLDPLDDVDAKAGTTVFSRRTTRLPDGLRIAYRLDTGASEIAPPGEAEAIYALSDKIKDEVGIEFYLEKSSRPSPAPNGIDPTIWSAIKPDMEKAIALTQKNDQAANLEALSLLATVAAKLPHPSQAAGVVDGMKGAILSELRRPQAALAALQSATAQYDGNPPVFRLWLAHELDYGTADSFIKAVQRTHKVQPQIVAEIDKQWVRFGLQKTLALAPERRAAARQDLCIALDQGGWQQSPRTDFGNNMLGCAIEAYSLRGELAQARVGLAKGPAAQTLVTLAIDRSHQALWPDIDRIGADRFRKSLMREADQAEIAAKAAPRDYGAVTYQMQTLRALGRFQDALAVGKALAGDTAQIEVAGTDAFWLVNEYAGNLRALGRMDEAIAALDGVLALGVERYPDLASIAVNRAEFILAAGRFQAALDRLNELETRHFDTLSPYGKMWVWADKTCALEALGRSAEAKALAEQVAAKSGDNWSAVTKAAACRNDTKAIADSLLRRLGDSTERTGALGLFITFETPEAHTAFDQAQHQAIAKARALPAVQAEFAKYGRVVRYAGTSQGWSDF